MKLRIKKSVKITLISPERKLKPASEICERRCFFSQNSTRILHNNLSMCYFI